MDKGFIKEFLATAGVGLTSQYVEQVGRKLLGGLLGAVAGGLGRGLGSVAAGAAFSVAAHYCVGSAETSGAGVSAQCPADLAAGSAAWRLVLRSRSRLPMHWARSRSATTPAA